MITVTVADDPDQERINITVRGHANPTNDKTDIQVCAAVSMLVATLYSVDGVEGEWDGDGSGYMHTSASRAHWPSARFVLSGIRLIARIYLGHVLIKNSSTRIEE